MNDRYTQCKCLLEANNPNFSFSQEDITSEEVNEFLKTSFNISRLIRKEFKNNETEHLKYDLTYYEGKLKSPTLKKLNPQINDSYFGNNNLLSLALDGDIISIRTKKGKAYEMSGIIDKELDQTFKKLIPKILSILGKTWKVKKGFGDQGNEFPVYDFFKFKNGKVVMVTSIEADDVINTIGVSHYLFCKNASTIRKPDTRKGSWYNYTPLTKQDTDKLYKLTLETDKLLLTTPKKGIFGSTINQQIFNALKPMAKTFSRNEKWSNASTPLDFLVVREKPTIFTKRYTNDEDLIGDKDHIMKYLTSVLKKHKWKLIEHPEDYGYGWVLYDKNKKIIMSLMWNDEPKEKYDSFSYKVYCSNPKEITGW